MTSAGESCKTDKSNLEGTIDELEKEKRALGVRVAELEKQLNSERESLNAQTAVVNSEIAELNRKLSESNTALGSITEEHEDCKGREHECKSEKDKHAKDVARLTAELEEAMTLRTSLEEQIEALKSQSGDETK